MGGQGQVLLFAAAALLLAIVPGPGMLYVAARTLAGGRGDGLASSVGTGLGGFVHVVAGAIGVSAVLMASADAFAAVKLAGAAYLVWLGIRTWAGARIQQLPGGGGHVGWRRAFAEVVVVEAFNPKTAAFFLAFITQFIDPSAGQAALHFAMLGGICVFLNTGADVIVVFFAASLRRHLAARPDRFANLQRGSGALLCGLGVALAFARRPAA